jgi:S-DNA-T family DNA segregation ATPase FtsK/SpoIIIE
VRIQGVYISERDINAVVNFLKDQGRPEYSQSAIESAGTVEIRMTEDEGVEDAMFEKALDFVLATKHGSASMLQRKFKLGYTRAARLIDMMEERGYVGPHDGRKPREVYGTPADRIAELVRREAPTGDAGPGDSAEDDPEDFEDE